MNIASCSRHIAIASRISANPAARSPPWYEAHLRQKFPAPKQPETPYCRLRSTTACAGPRAAWGSAEMQASAHSLACIRALVGAWADVLPRHIGRIVIALLAPGCDALREGRLGLGRRGFPQPQYRGAEPSATKPETAARQEPPRG